MKVAAIDQPAEVSAAVLLDVSGSGMKLISDRDWPVGSRLVVEMENHVVLACVRNGDARGSQFSLGAEKLYSILKLVLPPDAPRADWHRILLAEAERAGKLPSPKSPSSEPPETAHSSPDQAKAHHAAIDTPSPPLAQILNQETLDAQTVALLMRDLLALERKALDEQTPAKTLLASTPGTVIAEQALEEIVRRVAGYAETTKPEEHDDPPFAEGIPVLPAMVVRPRDIGIPARVAPDFGPAYDTEPPYDTEPAADVRALTAKIADTEDLAKPKPRWMLPAGVVGSIVASVVAVIALGFYYGPFRPSVSSPPLATATRPAETPVATPPVTEKPADEPASAQTTVAQPPSAIATSASPTPIAPVEGTRRATVKASGTNWVSACSDGKAAFAGLLSAGNVRDIDFQHTAVIRVGNAAAAEIYVDGKSIGSLGAPGAVKILEISGAGLRSLPLTLAPETECQPKP